MIKINNFKGYLDKDFITIEKAMEIAELEMKEIEDAKNRMERLESIRNEVKLFRSRAELNSKITNYMIVLLFLLITIVFISISF